MRHRTTIVSRAAVFGDDVFGNEVFFLGIGRIGDDVSSLRIGRIGDDSFFGSKFQTRVCVCVCVCGFSSATDRSAEVCSMKKSEKIGQFLLKNVRDSFLFPWF